ncbi:hypothetical protein BsWGS_21753 [Bradybaena similaris]
MGVENILETFFRAVSRVLPQNVNSVPLPKNDDLFRFLPFRGIGHGSAIAEVVRDQYSEDVQDLLNDVTSVYILCHASFQALCAVQGGGKLSLAAFFDSLIFDGLASAIIPCFICCHVTRITGAVLRELNCVPPAVLKWGPVVMGLGVLAFTYELIDRCVDRALDETIRLLY